MDAAAHSIADPVRRGILDALARRPHTAGEVAALFTVSRPAVSKHLRVLREAGLVASTAQGRRRVYTAELAPLDELETWIANLRQPWALRFDALETEVHRTRRDRRGSEATSRERSA